MERRRPTESDPGTPKKSTRQPASTRQPPGFQARQLAVELISAVLDKRRAFDEALAVSLARPEYRALAANDRGLARLIAATVLRRHGQLTHLIHSLIERPLPRDRGRLTSLLLAAAAQLVFLGSAPPAVINLSVQQARRDRRPRRFDGLTNAVLRRVAERGAEIAAGQDPVRLNIPEWLWKRWSVAYGDDTARQIAEASLREAPLDITVKSDAEGWSRRLGGVLLPTGS